MSPVPLLIEFAGRMRSNVTELSRKVAVNVHDVHRLIIDGRAGGVC